MPFEILSPSEQVAKHLRDLIMKGKWGNQLPGTPTLSKETGIDRKTITGAITLLEQEGILVSQGTGKPRKIDVAGSQKNAGLKINILLYEERNRTELVTQELCRRLRTAGHNVHLSKSTLTSMQMDLDKVTRYVKNHTADVWIVIAGSREILQWFSKQSFPTMALYGRRREIDIAAVGPDKIAAMRELTEKLITLGHRRIVLFSREERRHPQPGAFERQFLQTLDSHGITSNTAYHLPEWTSNAAGFKQCFDELFRFTPPTALIVEESQFLFAALQHLGRRGLSAPENISIACTDDDLVFDKSDPRVTCIQWQSGPVIDHIVKWVRGVSHGRMNRKQKLTKAEVIQGGTIGLAPVIR